ncbi:DNA/RNA non-specific endonuclease [Hoeflea sp. WL0058]|uniref:DNA/RNA non-specific endonuclease n=1 Tax=Flavimaribacter sediminis TaxID=2865987 RepID=A0AAE2ZT36_9HYPH|nr:DNA/RNA non-specific endonuclease [Flavimaribacter sediminis]MBW8640366.1 DNA/RNA non-specific endonuclease [Flavimaribacter sediminis]
MGYDENFLQGHRIPLPTASTSIVEDLYLGGQFVHHSRISVLFNKRRGFTACSAHNVDGSSLPEGQWTKRNFKLDPKIKPTSLQVGDKRGYWKNDWDRGHMARRKSMSWGNPDDARQAELESDYFSNICPQHENLHDIAWGKIEDWMLELANDNSSQACVFTGPVFTPDDPEITNAPGQKPVKIPAGFWKIIVVLVSDKVRAAAFLVWQRDYDTEEPLPFAPVLEQVRITTVEVLSGLTFSTLRKYDPMLFDRRNNIRSEITEAGLRGVLYESASGSPLELTEEAIRRFARATQGRNSPGIFSPADIIL